MDTPAAPVWAVLNWQPIKTTPKNLGGITPKMRMWGASTQRVTGDCRRQGQVLWGTDTPDGPLGMAWDWIEFREDVIVMLDPMTVLSNAVLVDEEGETIDPSYRVVHLNTVVHELNWQAPLTGAGRRRSVHQLPLSSRQQLDFLTAISQ